MADAQALVGRAPEIAAALSHIRAGRRLLVKGRPGIGKSALLRTLYDTLRNEPHRQPALIWVPPGNTKTALLAFARQLHAAAGLGSSSPHCRCSTAPGCASRASCRGTPWCAP